MKKLISLIILSIFSSNFLNANDCLNKCEQKYKRCSEAFRKSKFGWEGVNCEQMLLICKIGCQN